MKAELHILTSPLTDAKQPCVWAYWPRGHAMGTGAPVNSKYQDLSFPSKANVSAPFSR
jgi:hypothetical protein